MSLLVLRRLCRPALLSCGLAFACTPVANGQVPAPAPSAPPALGDLLPIGSYPFRTRETLKADYARIEAENPTAFQHFGYDEWLSSARDQCAGTDVLKGVRFGHTRSRPETLTVTVTRQTAILNATAVKLTAESASGEFGPSIEYNAPCSALIDLDIQLRWYRFGKYTSPRGQRLRGWIREPGTRSVALPNWDDLMGTFYTRAPYLSTVNALRRHDDTISTTFPRGAKRSDETRRRLYPALVVRSKWRPGMRARSNGNIINPQTCVLGPVVSYGATTLSKVVGHPAGLKCHALVLGG